jgi:hypothetical protein
LTSFLHPSSFVSLDTGWFKAFLQY